MPPNIKFPKHITPTDLGDDLESSLRHAPPVLATAEDVLSKNNSKQKQQEEEYFHHDIEDDTNNTSEEHLSSEGDSKAQVLQEEEEEDEARRSVRQIIRKFSTNVVNPAELSIDEKRLQHVLKDTGMYAYGIQGIAVWQFDEDHDRLVSPQGGFWYHPDQVTPSDSLERLVDSSRADHVRMVPVAPGVDIAGVLWLESDSQTRVESFLQRATSLPQLASPKHSTNSLGGLFENSSVHTKALAWRELKTLVQDPDTAKGSLMLLLEQAGFGQAAAIRFKTELTTVLVIYFAKIDADLDVLNGTSSVSYLCQSAQFIGTAAAMTELRRAIVGHQLEKQLSTGGVIMSSIGGEEDTADETFETNIKSENQTQCCAPTPTYHRAKVWLYKSRGGGLQVPPALSFRQSLWTALGAFIGLLVLSSLNEYYKYVYEYSLLIGPFGAMMTLCYALTSAPASQPRNAVMGQAVAGAVSMSFTYISEEILPVWLRRAVGPAVAIATMAKFGIVHPPAGAHAVLYASGDYNFAFYALVVLSTVISILPATFVNNLSRKRQYPIYWGVPLWLQSAFDGELGPEKKSNAE